MASIKGWLKLSTNPTQIVAHSSAVDFHEHYIPQLNESARCLGPECELCAIYPRRRVVTFVAARTGSYEYGLVKLHGERDPMADKLLKDPKLIGKIFLANWLDAEHKMGLQLRAIDRTRVIEIPHTRYVSAIGVAAYFRALDSLAKLDI